MDILIWADLRRMLYQTGEAYLPFVSAKERYNEMHGKITLYMQISK